MPIYYVYRKFRFSIDHSRSHCCSTWLLLGQKKKSFDLSAFIVFQSSNGWMIEMLVRLVLLLYDFGCFRTSIIVTYDSSQLFWLFEPLLLLCASGFGQVTLIVNVLNRKWLMLYVWEMMIVHTCIWPKPNADELNLFIKLLLLSLRLIRRCVLVTPSLIIYLTELMIIILLLMIYYIVAVVLFLYFSHPASVLSLSLYLLFHSVTVWLRLFNMLSVYIRVVSNG